MMRRQIMVAQGALIAVVLAATSYRFVSHDRGALSLLAMALPAWGVVALTRLRDAR